MFGIRLIAAKCKECYFDRLVIEFTLLHDRMAYGLHVIYVLSIILSPALAQKYSS